MTNSRATGKNRYVLLDNHVATGTEASYTYTPAVALDFDNYSAIIMYIDGNNTASLELEATANAVGSTHSSRGARFTGSAVTAMTAGATESGVIIASTTLLASAYKFSAKVTITNSKPTGYLLYATECTAWDSSEWEVQRGQNTTASITTLTSLKINCSTSSLAIGTRYTTYGVKRT